MNTGSQTTTKQNFMLHVARVPNTAQPFFWSMYSTIIHGFVENSAWNRVIQQIRPRLILDCKLQAEDSDLSDNHPKKERERYSFYMFLSFDISRRKSDFTLQGTIILSFSRHFWVDDFPKIPVVNSLTRAPLRLDVSSRLCYSWTYGILMQAMIGIASWDTR